ncbi:hypothetical protein [uncultured Roseobacter sp.]|uniref:hypothetical protein n=1 Tax=uncultured Roseobacter sp. TaxID=114847 RepID=UPI002631FF75|nr:hypothetical protein [uncultured Roseobacter sp.]
MLWASTLRAEDVQLTFEVTEVGALTDPTGLFTEEEVEQGGSVVQPSVWYSTFPVDGGEITLSILVDRWCGLSECPFRFRIETEDGTEMRSHFGRAHGMICQDRSSMTVDTIELVLTACGNEIDLKQAW